MKGEVSVVGRESRVGEMDERGRKDLGKRIGGDMP